MGDKGRVFVVAGPSGAGKDTLIRRALRDLGDIHYSVSVTTRPPREGEMDGRDYHFVSAAEFGDLVREGALLEWEEVHGKKYGTLQSEIEKATAALKNVLLELDVKGALNVKSKMRDAVLVFIMPPSEEELLSRLKGRGSDREEEIGRRIDVARWEMEVGREKFDVVIINDELDDAVRRLEKILRG